MSSLRRRLGIAVAVALWGWGAYLVERPKAARERAVADRLRAKRVDTVQELQAVEQTIGNLRERYGHNDDSAREAVAFLLGQRYRDVD